MMVGLAGRSSNDSVNSGLELASGDVYVELPQRHGF